MFIIVVLHCISQSNYDSLFFAKMPVRYINISKKIKDSCQAIPFMDINIQDGRFDTSAISFIRNSDKHYFEKVSLQRSLATQFKEYILKNYKPADSLKDQWKLLLIIEKLWISYPVIDDPKKVKSVISKQDFVQSCLNLSAKLMAEKNDSCYALYSLNTPILFMGKKDYKDSYIIQCGIDSLLSNIAGKKINEVKMHKKCFSFTDVQDYIVQEKQIPILTDTVYKKGVFKTYEEFKQNRPSIPAFVAFYSTPTDLLYTKDEKGDTTCIKDFWGFSDGKQLFINQASNFFELIRYANTFYINGFEYIRATIKQNYKQYLLQAFPLASVVNAAATDNIVYEGNKIPLQLDMETGNLF